MKKIAFALTLLILLTGCGKLDNQNANTGLTELKYTNLSEPTSVYDEYENQVGFLVIGQTDQCGSSCVSDLLFISNGSKPSVKKLDKFSADLLGFNIYKKDNNVYLSTFVDGENEGHFGCHKFKIQKIKYIKGEFVVAAENFTTEKYAFDLGDAQGKCNLFPGLKTIINKGFNA